MSGLQKCGFCSLLSGLVRRAMCIGSRRGSSESYYRELGDQDTLKIDDKSSQGSDVSVEIHVTFPQNGSEHETSNGQEYEQANDDRQELEESTPNAHRSLDSAECETMTRKKLTGRFLSMHKRRRRRLLTRSLCQEEALLDDLLLGQVQCILGQCVEWRFNAFTLDNVSGGRCLPVFCVHLFHTYGLISHFRLDPAKVWKLFSLIEEGYHSSNPYHNAIHAADVTQAMHCFLQQRQILEHLTPVEGMASLLAAITHDLDHPGVNQTFLIATSNHLAALYRNTSVLENHHWRSAISCLIESQLLDKMPEQQSQLEKQISSLILATDITKQLEYLGQFKNHLDTNTLDMTRPEHRHLVLQIALKCADISNPCRPWEISRKWSLKVCEEFYRQGDYERRLNLPVTALCDRHTNSIPKIQIGFFKFVVTPLITEWHRFLKTDLSAQMLENLVYNQKKWELLVAEEISEETVTEISDADMVDDDLETATNISDSSELLLPPPRRSSLNPSKQKAIKEHLRRFSVPLNVFQDSRLRNRDKGQATLEADMANRESSHASDLSLHSLSRHQNCEKVLSSEKLLPDTSIASITTPMQATRLSALFRHGCNWKLVRQQTFPPLELSTRSRSLIPRTSSDDDCWCPARSTKSDSGMRFEIGRPMLDGRQRRQESEKAEGVPTGAQLRDNLTAVQLATGTDLNRRRKSMPADALTVGDIKVREILPELIRHTLSSREKITRRRGSAPATATLSELRALHTAAVRQSVNGGGRWRGGPAAAFAQWLSRPVHERPLPMHLPRRSSLPVEVFRPTEVVQSTESK